jgi:hypothetical protein
MVSKLALFLAAAMVCSAMGERAWPDGEPNQTPYVRQTVEGFWECGIPDYKDLSEGYHTRLFAAEGEAKAWCYSTTGAVEPLQWETPPGLVDSRIDQIAFAGVSGNNANYEAHERVDNEKTGKNLEHPIIDAELSHREHQTYHDTWNHMSTINADGTEHGTNDKIEEAKNQARRAKRNARWTKSIAARHHNNGGNNRLHKNGKGLEATDAKKYAEDEDVQRDLEYGTRKDNQQDQIKDYAGANKQF